MDKTSKQLERYFKGVANHRRIDILFLVRKKKEMNVEDIANALHANFKTISAHTHKLVQAGLLRKTKLGTNVLHSLSPYGEQFHAFLKSFK